MFHDLQKEAKDLPYAFHHLFEKEYFTKYMSRTMWHEL